MHPMRHRLQRAALGLALTISGAALAFTSAALAQDDTAAADRAAIDRCVKAAKAGKAYDCIGRVSEPCMKLPGGESTAGMGVCIGRETVVWDARLNADYRAVLASPVGRQAATRVLGSGDDRGLTGAELIRTAQRAWIAFRDAKCEAAQLPMEGGSGMSTLVSMCLMQETARQDIWLVELTQP